MPYKNRVFTRFDQFACGAICSQICFDIATDRAPLGDVLFLLEFCHRSNLSLPQANNECFAIPVCSPEVSLIWGIYQL